MTRSKAKPGRRPGKEHQYDKDWRRIRKYSFYPKIVAAIEKNCPTRDPKHLITGYRFDDGSLAGPKAYERFCDGDLSCAFRRAEEICAALGTNLNLIMSTIITNPYYDSNRFNTDEFERQLDIAGLVQKARIDTDIRLHSSVAKVMAVLLEHSDSDVRTVASELVADPGFSTAKAWDDRFPGRGLGQILEQHTGVSKFQALDPLDNPKNAEVFHEIVGPHWETADTVLGWGEFLPCSFSTPEFSRAHHSGLFLRRTSSLFTDADAAEVADTFEEIGARNREASHKRLAQKSFSYQYFMSESVIEKISLREHDFFQVTHAQLREQSEYMRSLESRFEKRISVALLGPRGREATRQEMVASGADSIFMLVKGTKPLSAAKRLSQGQIIIVNDRVHLDRIFHWFMGLRVDADQEGLAKLILALSNITTH